MVRSDFVSNSSSSSFIFDKSYFSDVKHEIPTLDQLINAIRRNYFPEDWIHKNCYMQVLDMDEVRKHIKGKISYKKLCDYNGSFNCIDGFEDQNNMSLPKCVVNSDSKYYVYMGDNDCYGMIDAQTDNQDKFKTRESCTDRIFDLIFRELGIPFQIRSKHLHGNGHLG